MLNIISWNVNGIRACKNKGFVDFIKSANPDIICLQETKSDKMSANLTINGYEQYWNPAEKRGYAGTAIYTKYHATSSSCGVDHKYMDEGRVITLEYQSFYLVNCYAPHSQRDLNHLQYKHEFNCALCDYIKSLIKQKPVILCGDLNVAHNDIDLANNKTNRGNAGFTDIEREDMSRLLSIGLIDSYRWMYPKKEGAYTWWSYMKDVRKRNIGWRIDYALISKELKTYLSDAVIHSDVFGSDHCPIGLIINMEMGLS